VFKKEIEKRYAKSTINNYAFPRSSHDSSGEESGKKGEDDEDAIVKCFRMFKTKVEELKNHRGGVGETGEKKPKW
jgi:hypothetical protein